MAVAAFIGSSAACIPPKVHTALVACEESTVGGQKVYRRTGFTDSCCGSSCSDGGFCYLPQDPARWRIFENCVRNGGKRGNIMVYSDYEADISKDKKCIIRG
ncbi:hypothetical protein FKW77_002775 [Venturia effusa]|uniref:Uncharacterized protein n=1 Tax=Venturia effusa TaxID=50376 RepID=A0A517L8W7_9PEZI|nr:hypothetical protein FKW77_002775 [Venturia effusa]